MSSWGMAIALSLSSIPRSRTTSTVRWFVMWARGEWAVPLYLVTVSDRTPWRARSAAAVRPAGPAPMTRTSVSMVFMIVPLVLLSMDSTGSEGSGIDGCLGRVSRGSQRGRARDGYQPLARMAGSRVLDGDVTHGWLAA